MACRGEGVSRQPDGVLTEKPLPPKIESPRQSLLVSQVTLALVARSPLSLSPPALADAGGVFYA